MKHIRNNILEKINLVFYLENKKEIYTNILKIVKEGNVNITKNIRGYWFDVNELSDECLGKLNLYLIDSLKN
jgi:transcription antitermination factor NusA-like protein